MSAQDEPISIPLPRLYEWNRPYFAAAAAGKFMLQQCRSCGALIYYPRPACPECLSMDYDWVELSGRGVVYAYTIVRRPQHPAFLPRVPFVVATIQLDEGPQMVSNIVNCAPHQVEIGLPVRVVFERVSEGIALPKFELVDQG